MNSDFPPGLAAILLALCALFGYIGYQLVAQLEREQVACAEKGGEWVSGRVQTCFAKGTVIEVRK